MALAALFSGLGNTDFAEVWWGNELPVMAFSAAVPAWLDVNRFTERLSSTALQALHVLIGAVAFAAVVMLAAFYGDKFHVYGLAIPTTAKPIFTWVLVGLAAFSLLVRAGAKRASDRKR
jgi:predicted membrane protein